MEPIVRQHLERCDLCDNQPACVPACPQQVLAIKGQRIVMTHTDRCPEDCTVCVESCPTNVFALVEEVHSGLGVVPTEKVDRAARVHHVAYLREENATEQGLRDRFLALMDTLEIPADNRSMGETRAHGWGDLPGAKGVSLQLVWELHTEYYFVRAVITKKKGGLPDEKHLEQVVAPIHAFGLPPLLTCLDMLVSDRPMKAAEVCDYMVCRNRFGAAVLDGELSVYTNYEPMEGRERYVIAGSKQALVDHGSFAVANIGRIENYYHLLMLPRQEVRDAITEVHKRERALAARTEKITEAIESATHERMEEWLKALTVDMAQIIRLSSRFNHALSATFPYTELVREGFAGWKEKPVNGFDSLSGLILDRTRTVGEEYRAFLSRLDRMENEISDLVAILRTRVEMTMEAQNTELLKNLDTRSAIQLRLQEMAEGLSVIVISYYTTSLAGYVFKALEKKDLIESATLPTALFIPVAVLMAFSVTRRGLWKLKKKKKKLTTNRRGID